MATRRRRGLGTYAAEAAIVTIVVGLIFAGAFVGWIVGHYATPGHTKTVTVAAGGTSASSSEDIQTAPSFSASDLVSLPTDDWPTAGGNLRNERYSPLTQIGSSNI